MLKNSKTNIFVRSNPKTWTLISIFIFWANISRNKKVQNDYSKVSGMDSNCVHGYLFVSPSIFALFSPRFTSSVWKDLINTIKFIVLQDSTAYWVDMLLIFYIFKMNCEPSWIVIVIWHHWIDKQIPFVYEKTNRHDIF
jgi:hypothetical protein